MRMIIALVPVALGLAACQIASYPPQPYPTPYPGPAAISGEYRAIGTEPFWDLTLGTRMTFTNRGSNLSVNELTPPAQNGVAGTMYSGRRIRVNVVRSRCSDGMSERSYPDTVQVYVDGKLYQGCGAPASFFMSVDERGNPRVESALPGPATTLEQTRWRVVRVNGRTVPRQGEYQIDFDGGRISAKFGCNRIGGTYSQAGNTLDVGALMATRMACPNMRLETEGSAILGQVMTVAVTGRNRLTLSSNAGTIDLVRR